MHTHNPNWVRELLQLPARALPQLPEPMRISLYLPVINEVLVVATNELAEPREASEWATLDGLELLALIRGAEAGRFWPEDLVALWDDKRAEPGHRLTMERAMAGASCDPDDTRLDVAGLCAHLGVEVIAVGLAAGEETPIAA